VKVLLDARLREEAARLGFRFACEDCVHFAPERDACSLGYHAAPRRAELEATARDGRSPCGPTVASLELCKTFELA
jgi:hypothetical protein